MSEPTPDPPATRLALSARSIGYIVLTVFVVSALIAVTRASARVLGWMLAAAAIAALLEPLVEVLTRFMRRGIAVLVTMLLVLGVVGGVAFFTINDVVREVRLLQRAAPERAKSLEESDRFGPTARAFKLEARTRAAVREIPDRLRGGSNADAIRAAGTRGVAYLATTVLTVFLVLNGKRIVLAGLSQIRDEARRRQLHVILRDGGRAGVQYTTASLAMAASVGLLVVFTAQVVDVPGPVPLGLWAALWDFVPLIGAVVGALPVAILAAAESPIMGVVVLLAFIAYELFESAILQRHLEQRSVHVGPFLSLAIGSIGLELYGLGGALFALFAASVGVGCFEVWRRDSA
ncbi:MAG TPA: AI-2E family transporter [Acidimicrobiales bacterium]|nr:AI-2E family transporter [Acidimicrobiales bacterium]